MYAEIRNNISKLSKAIGDIEGKARNKKRELTAKETGLVAEIEAEIEAQRNRLPANSPMTMANGRVFTVGGSSDRAQGPGKPYQLRSPADRKGYADLFGLTGYKWEDKNTSFFDAVFSGRHHPGLLKNAAMTEGSNSDGGFLIPVEYSSKIHAVSLENEIILPRAFVQPMRSNEINLPGFHIGDHSSSLYGGFTASYVAETGTISEANPKTRDMTLAAKKLTGLLRFSSELAADVPGGENQIVNICGKGLSWYRDKAFLKGSGAGEPLGILNSPCLIAVDPEGGQGADTIIYENLTKMMSRMYAGSFGNSVWICHQSTIPQLLGLSISVGTGGSAIPVMSETNGQFKILTRPVIFTEKTEKLGDQGDILLADLSQYVIGLREGMRFDMSIHVHFKTDELLARLIERHDGQPLWDSTLTLEDGSTTVSPFVTLAERS